MQSYEPMPYCMASGSKPEILVSACLLGTRCRFDGRGKPCAPVRQLARHYKLVPICPEVAAALPIPRTPSERDMVNGGTRVLSSDGEDRTEAFLAGAQKTLQIAGAHRAKLAILKAKSPACGVGKVYDGTFSGTLADGDGVATALLKREGITCITEEQLGTLDARQLLALALGDSELEQ